MAVIAAPPPAHPIFEPGDADSDVARTLRPGVTPTDRLFRRVSTGAGLLTLVVLVLIGAFLLAQAVPTLRREGTAFFTGSAFIGGTHPQYGIVAVLYWTVVIAFIAMVLAVPVSVLAALFLTDYAPRRLRRPLTSLVDLLAAIPSLVYGIWGLLFLIPKLVGTAGWLSRHAGFIPFFHASVVGPHFGGSAIMAGIVVSLMVLPITTSIMREVFSQAPVGEKEAALALGSTRWGMIRTVVLPFGRGGMIGGTMLGLGRALGETIAVAIVIGTIFHVRVDWITQGANGIAPLIALKFGEADDNLRSALMAAGLVLFALTLSVNFAASAVVARSRSGAGVEL